MGIPKSVLRMPVSELAEVLDAIEEFNTSRFRDVQELLEEYEKLRAEIEELLEDYRAFVGDEATLRGLIAAKRAS